MESRLIIKSDEERFVLSEVYVPDGHLTGRLDTDQEMMNSSAIRDQAHDFLMSGRVNKIDVGHKRQESGCLVCESFIVRSKNDPDGFPKGAWVLGVKVLNDEVWQQIKKGELNSFSWSGPATVTPTWTTVAAPVRMKGDTEPYPVLGNTEQSHKHDIDVGFSPDGKPIPSQTSTNQGHFHFVEKTTATTEAAAHSHRIVIE